MELRLDKDTDLPCIMIELRPNRLIKGMDDDMLESFMDKALEKGVSIGKACDHDYCHQHYKITINK